MKSFDNAVAQQPNLMYSTQRSFEPLLLAFHCAKEINKIIRNGYDCNIRGILQVKCIGLITACYRNLQGLGSACWGATRNYMLNCSNFSGDNIDFNIVCRKIYQMKSFICCNASITKLSPNISCWTYTTSGVSVGSLLLLYILQGSGVCCILSKVVGNKLFLQL